MAFTWTDDPIADAERYYNALDEKLAKQPVCCGCGGHIQEEKAVQIDGDWYCKQCEPEAWERIREEFLVRTTD